MPINPALQVVDIAAATHQGHVRETNEDHYLVMRFGRSLQNLLTNLNDGQLARSYDLTGFSMLVADGMGDMAGGEVASSTAVARIVQLIIETPDWMMALNAQEQVKIV